MVMIIFNHSAGGRNWEQDGAVRIRSLSCLACQYSQNMNARFSQISVSQNRIKQRVTKKDNLQRALAYMPTPTHTHTRNLQSSITFTIFNNSYNFLTIQHPNLLCQLNFISISHSGQNYSIPPKDIVPHPLLNLRVFPTVNPVFFGVVIKLWRQPPSLFWFTDSSFYDLTLQLTTVPREQYLFLPSTVSPALETVPITE